VLRNTPEDKQYSFACAIPNDATGLRYLAREPLDYGRPRHDHPLGSRFEEPDAVVVFDDVHVPYERCFALGDAELAQRRQAWTPRRTDYQSGTLWKYAQTVGDAEKGAVTHPGARAETHTYADI